MGRHDNDNDNISNKITRLLPQLDAKSLNLFIYLFLSQYLMLWFRKKKQFWVLPEKLYEIINDGDHIIITIRNYIICAVYALHSSQNNIVF